MKLVLMILGIFGVILGYGLINYYVGLRGFQFLKLLNIPLNIKLYWLIFWFVALSYILARVLRFLPSMITDWLTVIGSYWIGIMLYSFFTILIIDFLRFANKHLHLFPASLTGTHTFALSVGICGFLIVFGTIAYGVYNGRHPVVTHYDINVNKNASSLDTLHIAMVSDIHLGKMIGNEELTKMVGMINNLNPDIVIFGGDTIDESIESFMERNMTTTLSGLKSKYGVYGVLGNHEYYSGHPDEVTNYYTSAGIKILRDEYVKIDNGFYLAGREYRALSRANIPDRKKLSDVLKGTDSLPIILIDHEPKAVKEAEDNGVCLMLSGHTHHGQFFPVNLITSMLYEIDWGHLQRNNFNLIVTSGYGLWGPPIRVGNKPEVVDIMLHFK